MTAAQAATRLLELVNRERTERGLPPVEPRNDVSAMAMRWSATMARRGELSHNDGYFSPDTRRKLDARLLGENVARGPDVESAHRALMASEHHRANVLDRRFTVVGFGAELADGSWWFTQDFLQPVTRGAARKPRSSGAAEEHGPRSAVPDARPVGERGVTLAAVAPVPSGPIAAEEPASFRVERAAAPHGDLANRSPSRRQGAAVALLGGLLVVAFALRRWALHRIVQARRAHRHAAVLEERTDSTIEVDHEVGRQHLAVISSWTRTLEDRWATMPANDRRIVMQAIERSAEEALADMAMV